MMATSDTRADYGLDSPGVVRALTYGGLSLLVLSAGGLFILPGSSRALILTGLIWSLFMLGEVIYMVWSSYGGKQRQRERLLGLVDWRGDERVLDAGCGRGLLLIGAAKRLTNGGRAAGVDWFTTGVKRAPSPDAALENARREGVDDRVEVGQADLRRLPFEEETFDVIVSSMALHNIPDEPGRGRAIREMARVLRPGGRLLLQDSQKTARYLALAAEAGLTDVGRSGLHFTVFPPVRIVSARKP